MTKVQKFTEHEATWLVDPDKLPQEFKDQQPHIFLQAYRTVPGKKPFESLEYSIRTSPASRQAWKRTKTKDYGTRQKTREELNLISADKLIRNMPTAVLKERRICDCNGLHILIDYLPECDKWRAEVEFPTAAKMTAYRAKPEDWPEFFTEDVTDSMDGYTRYDAVKLTPSKLDELLNLSKLAGNKSAYNPPYK